MSLQEAFIRLQNEVHSHNVRERMLQFTMYLQALYIEMILPIKQIALQIEKTRMPQLEKKMKIL